VKWTDETEAASDRDALWGREVRPQQDRESAMTTQTTTTKQGEYRGILGHVRRRSRADWYQRLLWGSRDHWQARHAETMVTGGSDDRPDHPDDARLHARLAALRRGEPRFDVATRVRARIEAERRPVRRWGFLRPVLAVTALIVVLAFLGTAIVAPGTIRAAGNWFRALVVREEPQPGQPGGQRIVIPTAPPGGGPFRTVTLAEAQRAVAFPVNLPQSVPTGYALTTVQLFQPDPATPPQQAIVTYMRKGAPPFSITYDAPGTHPSFSGAPGATRQMTVGGYPAVYIDDALSGMKRPDGQPVATGRLVVERPDVVLLLGGDRDAELDADTLTEIAQSIS